MQAPARVHGIFPRVYCAPNPGRAAATEETMETEIPREEYERIQKLIGDETSPVGIDAKKTHIIIHKLISLEKRLGRLERRGSASVDGDPGVT